MTEKLGIENLKELVTLGAGLHRAYNAAKADGKIDFADTGHLIPLIPVINPALQDIDKVDDEIKDLDANEAEQLLVHARNELNYLGEDDKLLEIIVTFIAAGIAIARAVNVVVK